MPAPSSIAEFVELVRKSGVLDKKRLDAYMDKVRASASVPSDPAKLSGLMVRDGLLTYFQAEQLMLGKWRRFNIGKYKVLERLGSGGMGSVYLCEHKLMRRRVAVKVLPTAKADDPSSLERFYREARAVAALDHPNIVRAYDIDQDDNLHFLVMEYVDGASLQEVIKKTGAMDVSRAAHYIRQAAQGLQHAHETAGLVHRDIKPGNILVDRNGTVKILDMGLARFFHDEEDILTKKYDENVLGTADYLAPEQALDSHAVDIRADIYSLGATFYFCLTGRTPFSEGTVAQKLIWHQTRQPKTIVSIRPEVPEGLIAVIDKMMAKEAGQRYQTPQAVMDALVPWTQSPVAPPPDEEMPHLCPAALGATVSEPAPAASTVPSAPGMPSPSPKKNWQVSGSPTSRTPEAAPGRGTGTLPAPGQPRDSRGGPSAGATGPRAQGPATPSVQASSGNGQPLAGVAAPPETATAWERLAPDTDELATRADTAPGQPRKKGSSVSHLRMTPAQAERERRRIQWVVIIVSVVLVSALALTLVIVFSLGGGKEPPPPTSTVYVGAAAREGAVKNLHAAFAKVGAGGRIVVLDDTIEELPSFDSKRLKGVTLEADEGKRVVWRVPASWQADDKLNGSFLNLSRLDGFRIRGFTIDGCDKVKDLVVVFDKCPGLTLEDVELKGFTNSAVQFVNCQGTEERPIVLKRVRVEGNQKASAAFFFEIRPRALITVNSHIVFEDPECKGAIGTRILVKPADAIDSKTVSWPAGFFPRR
jgi:serine/threonine protein kinase